MFFESKRIWLCGVLEGRVASMTEFSQSLTREAFFFIAQAAHGWSAALLHLLQYRESYKYTGSRRNASKSRSNRNFYLTGEESRGAPAGSNLSNQEELKRPSIIFRVASFVVSLLLLLLMWVPVIGPRVSRSIERPNWQSFTPKFHRDVSMDRIQDHPLFAAEGFVERVQLGLLSFLEHRGQDLKRFIRWILRVKPKYLQPKRHRKILMKQLGKEGELVGEVVKRAGYPFERRTVETVDGHLLVLERLPKVGARKVAFLIHGVFDSAHAWVGTGVGGGLAFMLYDRGYDVFMGNLRGTRGKLHVNANISTKDYWDFSLDDHGMVDIPSFVASIREVKKSELSDGNISISAIAHSMGCAATTVYLIHSLRNRRSHYFNKVVYMSPAGLHTDIPRLCSVLGPIIDHVVARFLSGIFIPEAKLRTFASNLCSDLASTAGVSDLFAWSLSMLLGGTTSHNPVIASPGLMHTTLSSGTSMKVFKQFWHNYQMGGFYSFDQNINYLSEFYLMDVPIHFMAGARDKLIRPVDIRRQYATLATLRPQLASYNEFSGRGHLDFTYGMDEDMAQDLFAHCD